MSRSSSFFQIARNAGGNLLLGGTGCCSNNVGVERVSRLLMRGGCEHAPSQAVPRGKAALLNSKQAPMNNNLVNAVLLVTSIGFSFLFLEIGLRVYHGNWEFKNFRIPHAPLLTNSDVAFDAELGWVPKDNMQSTNVWGATVTTVEDGIRSNGSGEVRNETDEPILAVGDSYTWGDEVSDWETWPAQLEKLSGRRVMNGGVNGYGIDQAFLRARRLLNRYRLGAVIFSFIPDDISRCELSRRTSAAKPYFDFRNGRLTLENVPVPPPSRPKESWPLVALEHSQVVHSVMKRLFPEWWLLWEMPVHSKGGEVACALLHELEGLTKSRGSELIVLVQHTNWGEGSAESRAVKRVLSCLSDPTTRVFDLEPVLSELKAEDRRGYERLFEPTGGHMTAEGNQFVALEISKILAQIKHGFARGSFCRFGCLE
jgi:hypothetical protein